MLPLEDNQKKGTVLKTETCSTGSCGKSKLEWGSICGRRKVVSREQN